MDVYQYKRDIVEVQFSDDDFPLVTDALDVASDRLDRQIEAGLDRAETYVQKPFVGLLAAALTIPAIYSIEKSEGVFDDMVNRIHKGERRIQGPGCSFLVSAITMGMTELARQHEQPLQEMLATIRYRQLPKKP